jgi:hypothetical protein
MVLVSKYVLKDLHGSGPCCVMTANIVCRNSHADAVPRLFLAGVAGNGQVSAGKAVQQGRRDEELHHLAVRARAVIRCAAETYVPHSVPHSCFIALLSRSLPIAWQLTNTLLCHHSHAAPVLQVPHHGGRNAAPAQRPVPPGQRRHALA